MKLALTYRICSFIESDISVPWMFDSQLIVMRGNFHIFIFFTTQSPVVNNKSCLLSLFVNCISDKSYRSCLTDLQLLISSQYCRYVSTLNATNSSFFGTYTPGDV